MTCISLVFLIRAYDRRSIHTPVMVTGMKMKTFLGLGRKQSDPN